MIFTVTISTPDDLEDWERAAIEQVLGPGAFDDTDFVVYWRKYTDAEADGFVWNGWPFRRDVGIMHRVDHPDDWKHTWFLFTH